MITSNLITEIISLYKKHGWNISRVLLSDEVKITLADELDSMFDNAEIKQSKVDAVWFSRPSKNNNTAWELRHLSSNPFAIIEVFDENFDESEKDKALENAESRLTEHVSNK